MGHRMGQMVVERDSAFSGCLCNIGLENFELIGIQWIVQGDF